MKTTKGVIAATLLAASVSANAGDWLLGFGVSQLVNDTAFIEETGFTAPLGSVELVYKPEQGRGDIDLFVRHVSSIPNTHEQGMGEVGVRWWLSLK